MPSSFAISVFCFLVRLVAAQSERELLLRAQLFQLKGAPDVNNVKLNWGFVDPASYTIYRSTTSGESSPMSTSTTTGDTWDDYDLAVGTTYFYKVRDSVSGRESNEVSVTPFTPKANYRSYKNTEPSKLLVKGSIKKGDVYYRYRVATAPDGSFTIVESTSTDGYNFTGDTVVLDSAVICAAIKEPCHLERDTYHLHPTTGKVVMWAHFERRANYGLGQAASASGIPGSGPWVFHGNGRPLGHDSRDCAFFVDDDPQNTAYFISTTDVNTNMNIYKLSPDWTQIDSLAVTVLRDYHREAPSMIKHNGNYFLFTSRASGWYPSTPIYISSPNIASGWSVTHFAGNDATWAAQSGGVQKVGSQYVMMADRWGGQWDPPSPPNREIALPLSFAATRGEITYYNWYPEVMYLEEGVPEGQNVYGIQAAKILSRGKKVTSTPPPDPNSPIALAVDGTDDGPESYFKPKAVPFTLEVDLEQEYRITSVDLSPYFMAGSETYYQYTVVGRGAAAGAPEHVLADQMKNTVTGFVSSPVTAPDKYRFVSIKVEKVINTNNGHDADVFRGVVEMTVMGV